MIGGNGKVNILPPIRCVSCGNIIGDKTNYFIDRVKTISNGRIEYFKVGENQKSKIGIELDKMNINRLCCRRSFITMPLG